LFFGSSPKSVVATRQDREAREAGGSLPAHSASCGWQKRGEQAREAGDRKRREISIARFAGSFRLPPTLPTAGAVGYETAARFAGCPALRGADPHGWRRGLYSFARFAG